MMARWMNYVGTSIAAYSACFLLSACAQQENNIRMSPTMIGNKCGMTPVYYGGPAGAGMERICGRVAYFHVTNPTNYAQLIAFSCVGYDENGKQAFVASNHGVLNPHVDGDAVAGVVAPNIVRVSCELR